MSSEEGDIRRRAGAVALDDEYDGRCNLDGGLALFVGWTKPPIPEMEEDRTTMRPRQRRICASCYIILRRKKLGAEGPQ
jgi:hypothetical protein